MYSNVVGDVDAFEVTKWYMCFQYCMDVQGRFCESFRGGCRGGLGEGKEVELGVVDADGNGGVDG